MSDSSSIPYGYYQCGCGSKTGLAKQTQKARGRTKGKPLRFLRGHHLRKSGVDYLVQNCGYTTPCWIWQLTVLQNGYGQINRGGTQQYAHRAYYERSQGAIPSGLDLDHLCRNRACVNPAHLEPVTRAENARRGRRTKLTVKDVTSIKCLYQSGCSTRELADRFRVDIAHLRRIIKGTNGLWVDRS